MGGGGGEGWGVRGDPTGRCSDGEHGCCIGLIAFCVMYHLFRCSVVRKKRERERESCSCSCGIVIIFHNPMVQFESLTSDPNGLSGPPSRDVSSLYDGQRDGQREMDRERRTERKTDTERGRQRERERQR